jgi:pimeloyl-ACP methyl ester carboxylesterase
LAEGRLVLSVDQRNHGDSPHSDEFSFQTMAEDLRELMDDRGLARASLLGHSMGGKTAMEFALRYPNAVDGLVVIDIAPRAYPPGHDAILDAMTSLDLSAYASRSAIEKALEPLISDLRVRQFVLTNLRRVGEGRYDWKLNLKGLRSNYAEVIKAQNSEIPFRGPTLFIRGGNSNYIRPEDVASLLRLFPAATIDTVPGAGHWVHADAPAELLRLVGDFLSKLPG